MNDQVRNSGLSASGLVSSLRKKNALLEQQVNNLQQQQSEMSNYQQSLRQSSDDRLDSLLNENTQLRDKLLKLQ